MSLSINTNISSLNVQRNLNKTQSALATSMQRLSSGVRINSAKDDAAGLAISNRMTSQINGMNQAARNANDGISLAQTAEGAMEEMTSIMQRMRELAVQSANGINTTSDRQSMEAEVDQLQEELDRIATSTSFNGMKVLDGSQGTLTFQVGANAGQTISFSIDSVRAAELGVGNTTTVSNTVVATATPINSGEALNALNNYLETNFNSLYNDSSLYDPSTGNFTNDSGPDSSDSIAGALNSAFSGISAGGWSTSTIHWVYIDSGSLYISGTGASAEFTTDATTTTGSGSTVSMTDVSVLTQSDAETAMESIDAALSQVDEVRGELGAVQSRFESVINNLGNISENLSSARSRIQDADFATETSAMTKSSIMQQAGTQMLSTANQTSQIALSLIT
jgi:flagellin